MSTPTLDGPRRPAASGAPDALILLLHGYGADGNDLFGLAEPLSQAVPGAAFVSPHAPEPCRAAPVGRQWFPIPWIDGSAETEMIDSFQRSAAALDAFIDREIEAAGVAADRALLLGFSQGVMMSLHVGLRRAAALGGIVGFSGRLVAPERLATEIASRPPVFLTHGDRDEVIPVDALHEARNALSAVEVPVRWSVSPGAGHTIAPDAFAQAAAFIRDRLG